MGTVYLVIDMTRIYKKYLVFAVCLFLPLVEEPKGTGEGYSIKEILTLWLS